jgi:hypothetical protein
MTAKQFVDNWLKENCYHEWMCANTTFTENNAAEAAEAYHQYKSVPPVSQEAAPHSKKCAEQLYSSMDAKCICGSDTVQATAPDSAMRVAKAQLAEKEREIATTSHVLQNLLAVIHRDGGHHTAEYGLKISGEHAEAVVFDLMRRAEAAEQRLHEAQAEIARLTRTYIHTIIRGAII